MKIKHTFDINITIALESQLMTFLTSLLSGDEEGRIASATAGLKERTDNAAGTLDKAQGGQEPAES